MVMMPFTKVTGRKSIRLVLPLASSCSKKQLGSKKVHLNVGINLHHVGRL